MPSASIQPNMLRIMISEAAFEQKWILQGKLCGQWAADLREKWADTRSSRTGRNCVIDLEDVITVDQTGEKALLEMVMEGAQLTTRRAYMRSVLERLQAAPNEGNPNHVDH